ncbi:MAG: hypothetical protein R2874_07350 [Desulfobacterales bacterium]
MSVTRRAVEEAITRIDTQVDVAEADMAIQASRLDKEKAVLEEMAALLEKIGRVFPQNAFQQQYEERLDYYQAVKKAFEQQKADFERRKDGIIRKKMILRAGRQWPA